MQLKDSLLSELTEIVERNISRDDLFIVDIELKTGGKNPVLSVYIESDKGGIKLDDCADISRNLQTVIEANELLGKTFTLNVSSPGLDRPLILKRQYLLNKGRTARVKARLGEDDKVSMVEGKLINTEDNGIELESKSGTTYIEFDKIIETKIVPSV
ncbi:MAG: ribosome maturation factor [Balneolia bacterium]|nr:ribosome maturation factor [Balneolia bacterium]